MRKTFIVIASLAVVLLAPAGDARAQVEASVLVEVSPGVWVVEGADSAVFFSDGYYWRWYDGVWYRTPRSGGAWVTVQVARVPRPLVRIDRPWRYRRWHAPRGVALRRMRHRYDQRVVRVDAPRRRARYVERPYVERPRARGVVRVSGPRGSVRVRGPGASVRVRGPGMRGHGHGRGHGRGNRGH